MKKKIIVFTMIILCSLGITYGAFYIKRASAWNDFISEYSELNVKGFIHGNALVNAYTDETLLEELELISDGDLDIEIVKKDNEIANEAINTLITQLKATKKSPETKISNDETVEFGLVNAEEKSYLYVYKNGTVLLCVKGENYYVYKIKDLDTLKASYQEKIVSIAETDPYFQLSNTAEES